MMTPVTNSTIMTLFSSFPHACVETMLGENIDTFSRYDVDSPVNATDNMWALNVPNDYDEVTSVHDFNVSVLARHMNSPAWVLDKQGTYRPIEYITIEHRNAVPFILIGYSVTDEN